MHNDEYIAASSLGLVDLTQLPLQAYQSISGSQKFKVTKTHVHKNREDNVLVKSIACVDAKPEYDAIVSEFIFPKMHNFFFEHALDHIPGLMLVEAGRQAGVAMAHLLYNVGFDCGFVLDDVHVRFLEYGDLDAPVFSYNHITNKRMHREALIGLTAEGYFFQNLCKIVYMKSTWRMLSKGILARMRKQHGKVL